MKYSYGPYSYGPYSCGSSGRRNGKHTEMECSDPKGGWDCSMGRSVEGSRTAVDGMLGGRFENNSRIGSGQRRKLLRSIRQTQTTGLQNEFWWLPAPLSPKNLSPRLWPRRGWILADKKNVKRAGLRLRPGGSFGPRPAPITTLEPRLFWPRLGAGQRKVPEAATDGDGSTFFFKKKGWPRHLPSTSPSQASPPIALAARVRTSGRLCV